MTTLRVSHQLPAVSPASIVRVLAIAVLTGLLNGCGSRVDVRASSARDVAYGSYRTYFVMQQPVGDAGVLAEPIGKTIGEVMTRSGYARAAAIDEADLLVSWKLVVSGESSVLPLGSVTRPRAGAIGAAWDGALHADFVDATSVDATRHKTLLVLLQEVKTYRVVWMGWSSADIPESELAPKVSDAIRRIMARVPPRS